MKHNSSNVKSRDSLNRQSRAVLIPAAGYGRRVGSPEAKEMLLRPEGCFKAGEPMIAAVLDLAHRASARAHVITREDKKVLHEFLREITNNVSVQNIISSREWPETILNSQEYWADFNIVGLPDTDFLPLTCLNEMFELLEGNADIVFASFSVSDLKTWGAVRYDPTSNVWRHCEKPRRWAESALAWGLFGFRRSSGEQLLKNMLESTFDHNWRHIEGRVEVLKLERFLDLTR